MRIALLGYGKMGKEVESIASERGHHIAWVIDNENTEEICKLSDRNIDVAIDFTRAEVAPDLILNCFKQNIPVISGTTGWNERLDELVSISRTDNKGFLHASNFSLGVNIFFYINRVLARVMNPYTEYKTDITEIHHIHKLDKPSGTAISLAEGIMSEIASFNSWSLESDKESSIPIHAIREGEVPGTHKVYYESGFDQIKISHSAKSRKGFAFGAIIAAEFMQNKKGYYTMEDVLGLQLS